MGLRHELPARGTLLYIELQNFSAATIFAFIPLVFSPRFAIQDQAGIVTSATDK
jgi:hypothetical protein